MIYDLFLLKSELLKMKLVILKLVYRTARPVSRRKKGRKATKGSRIKIAPAERLRQWPAPRGVAVYPAFLKIYKPPPHMGHIITREFFCVL